MIDRTLEVDAKLDSLRAVGRWLAEAARDADIPFQVAFGLDLAVHEAVENVVRHGCVDGAPHRVHLTIRSAAGRVEIVVEDDGVAFDPLSVPAPDPPRRLEDLIPGGQGIHLMRHFTDEIRYHRAAGRNVLTLARTLAPRPDPR